MAVFHKFRAVNGVKLLCLFLVVRTLCGQMRILVQNRTLAGDHKIRGDHGVNIPVTLHCKKKISRSVLYLV